jgi:hypothetical protein
MSFLQSQRWRPAAIAAAVVVLIWVVAVFFYLAAKHATVTADKVRDYIASTDLASLSPGERAKALRNLEEMLNKLSFDERQRMRLERLPEHWFREMTDVEKAQFVEATMPTGFQQMLTAFEQLPEEKRRKTVDDAIRRLKRAQSRMEAEGGTDQPSTNAPPPLSPELEARVRTIGLQTFYSQSSAQTKAELAPVLEELQKVMQSGRPMNR